MSSVPVTSGVRIPADELEFGFTRSGGPGGQHVNTSSTKVELRFDVEGSPSLTGEQKAAIREHLGKRITGEGVLVLAASEYRSQARNREAVVARFANLLAEALTPRKPRRRTRRSRAAERRRLEAKRRRSKRKELRRPPEPPDG